MTRTEYELVYSAFRHYRCLMTDEQEVLSEKILDQLFYPSFDALTEQQELTGDSYFDDIDDEIQIPKPSIFPIGAV